MEDDLILLTEHGTAAPGDTGEKSLDSLHHGEMDSDNWTLIHGGAGPDRQDLRALISQAVSAAFQQERTSPCFR